MPKKNLFERVIGAIDRVREPGEKPKDDLYSMEKFVCDLCQGVVEKEGITQCGFCGRWVCRSCWNDELKACESCSGVILLAKEERGEDGKVKDKKDEDQKKRSEVDKDE